jgi:hypothetical protein
MKNLLITTLAIFATLHAFGKKIPGTILTKGETRNVVFDIKVPLLYDEPSFERLQFKVKYYDENGKKHILRPGEAEEIVFMFEWKEVRMISCDNTIGAGNMLAPKTKIFLKLEIDGPLRLYRYYYRQMNPGFGAPGTTGYAPSTSYAADDLVFQKGKGPLKQPRTFGWKKDMLEYFNDCPALRERIEAKDLRRQEIEAIVIYYNSMCGKK